MTDQHDLVRRIVAFLDKAQIPYMLSGSMSSSFYGHPRMTNDADIVIEPTREQLTEFVNSLGSDYYVSRQAAMQALEFNSMFNIIENQTGFKVDFIIRKNRPFSEEEFSRRRPANINGIDLYVVSPEDSILSKLEWSKDSRSNMQFNDVVKVIQNQWDSLDFEYLKKWAVKLQVEEHLEKLMEEVRKLK